MAELSSAEQTRAYEEEIAEPFARLRAALAECEALVRPMGGDCFVEPWEDQAVKLAVVFKWVVQRSGSNVHAGISKGGPAVDFVLNAMRKLGWANDRTPSEDALVQFLKRYRKQGDIPL